MINKLFISIFIAVFFLQSCKKNEDDYHSTQNIKVVNYSNYEIDTLTIDSYVFPEKLIFTNIMLYDTTEYKEIDNLRITFYFVAKLDNIECSIRWKFPCDIIDPTGRNGFCPSGNYTFCIINCDTINKSLTVGLTNYYFN